MYTISITDQDKCLYYKIGFIIWSLHHLWHLQNCLKERGVHWLYLDEKVSGLQNLDLSSSELMVRYGVKDLVPSTFCHLFPSAKLSHLQNCFNQPKSKHSTFFSLVDSLSQKFFITKFFLLLIATSFSNLTYYF